MAEITVNDVPVRVQYIVTLPTQDTFVYNFTIFDNTDLNVYLTPVGQTPDEDTDLLLKSAYTVNINPLADNTGDIVLNTPAVTGDILTVVQDVPFSQLVEYSVGGQFTADSIDQVIDKQMVVSQKVNDKIENRGLMYIDNDQLDANRLDNILPKLTEGQVWKKSTTGFVGADTTEPLSCSSLRTELIDNASGSDGAQIVGYFSVPNGATFVKDELDYLNGLILNEFKVKVTTNDTTGDFLNSTIVAGAGIQLTVLNPAADEQLEISTTSNAGEIIQVVYNQFGSNTIHTATIPIDNTIPQIGEGEMVMTMVITPKSATSRLHIEFGTPVMFMSGNGHISFAVFRQGLNNALGARFYEISTLVNINSMSTGPIIVEDTPGVVVPVTYQVRIGITAGENVNINSGNSGAAAPIFGGVSNTYMRIMEIAL